MVEPFIEKARSIANQLRSIDQRCVAFGAGKHRYIFESKLDTIELKELELEYEITLPSPYRDFLTELGNGGCGPYYGVLPLECSSHVGKPFPYSDTYLYPDDIDDEEFGAPLDGCIEIAEYGCGTIVFLIVCGKAKGEVWFDARYDSGLKPVLGEDGQRMAFNDWWLQHMSKHLNKFEQIRDLMEDATPHDKIHELLEPEILQLHVDEMMLSIMDVSPKLKPSKIRDKPWGVACGIVDDHYENWLRPPDEAPLQNKPRSLLSRLLRFWFG